MLEEKCIHTNDEVSRIPTFGVIIIHWKFLTTLKIILLMQNKKFLKIIQNLHVKLC
jgi:hypothetical protein